MKRLLAISLAVVLALGLAPGTVMALTQPSVSLDDDIISATGKYTIMFTIAEDVAEDEYIIIAFPDDTDITDVDATDCTITATPGIGSDAFVATAATSISKSDTELTITVPDVNAQDKIGPGAGVQVIVDDVLNPSIPGDYTLTVATSGETTPVESATYAIEIPAVGGIVQLYNPIDILMAQYTGDDAIQSAIDDAYVGWTVKVGAGTYEYNIELKEGVQVLGEGADLTIIDGGGSGSVVTAIGVGSETVLDGFTITGGNATNGGGMHNWESSPTVNDCVFSGNWAWFGGGMYNNESSPIVTNCTFTENSVAGVSGGMHNYFSSPTVTNCTFYANYGSGISNHDSSPTVNDCIFSANSATYGGGISSWDSSLVVTNCTFTENSATWGGGIRNGLSSATVTNCIFSANSALYGGGIDNWKSSALVVANCIFFDNSATYGGGISNYKSSPTATNCTFSNNLANEGGGMYNWLSSSVRVNNCILWEDSAPNGPEVYNSDSSPLISYTDIEGCGGSSPVWQISLGNDGGGNIDTMPLFVDPTGDDYHLQAGSLCVDKGTDVGAPTEDIEGNPRPIDGDGDSIAITDMGAYEYVPIPPIAAFSAEPTAGVAPLAVEFTDKSTGDITSCSWDFGDGNTSDEENPSHTYSTAGIYTVSLDVSGPGGTDTETKESFITVYEQEEATVDFDPDTLNLKSKGKVVTVYIELPEGYDVEEIDISTVMLNGIVPAMAKPTEIGDHDGDGVSDLMVKFDRSDVQDMLDPGDEVEVTVSGELTDETPFKGTDTIRVINKGKK